MEDRGTYLQYHLYTAARKDNLVKSLRSDRGHKENPLLTLEGRKGLVEERVVINNVHANHEMRRDLALLLKELIQLCRALCPRVSMRDYNIPRQSNSHISWPIVKSNTNMTVRRVPFLLQTIKWGPMG
jgi:hypothetical protein